VCAATRGFQGAGRDVTRAHSPNEEPSRELPMSRFVAPLTFTIAAAWVMVLFVLAHGNP
jgi:hypothetical protein